MAFLAPKIVQKSSGRLIFGCGNFFYPRARNSAGLLTVNRMAKVLGLPEWRLKKNELCWYTGGSDFYIVRPRVYPISEMPRALKRSMKFFGIYSARDVTIIHHDPQVPTGHFYATFGDPPEHVEHLGAIRRALGSHDFHHIGIGVGPLRDERIHVNHTLCTLVDRPMTNLELERSYDYNKFPDHHMKLLDEKIFTEESVKALVYTILHPTENFRSAEDIFPHPQLPPDEPTLSQVLGALKMGSQELLQK